MPFIGITPEMFFRHCCRCGSMFQEQESTNFVEMEFRQGEHIWEMTGPFCDACYDEIESTLGASSE